MVELNDKITGGDIGIITKPQLVDRLGYAQIGQAYQQIDLNQVKVNFTFDLATGNNPLEIEIEESSTFAGAQLYLLNKALTKSQLFLAHFVPRYNITGEKLEFSDHIPPEGLRLFGFGDLYQLKDNKEI
jgi:hypothetical protein